MKLHVIISSSAYLASPPEQLYLFRELIYVIVGQISAFLWNVVENTHMTSGLIEIL